MSQTMRSRVLLTRQYLLDTSITTGYLLGKSAVFELAHAWVENDEAATSILVYAEIYEYLKGFSDISKRLIALHTLLKKVYPYPLTYPIMECFAELRRAMRPSGLIGDIDTLIAATALVNELTVVTADKDFMRVPNLSVKYIPRTKLKR